MHSTMNKTFIIISVKVGNKKIINNMLITVVQPENILNFFFFQDLQVSVLILILFFRTQISQT